MRSMTALSLSLFFSPRVFYHAKKNVYCTADHHDCDVDWCHFIKTYARDQYLTAYSTFANQIPTYRYLYRGIFLQIYPWLRSWHGEDVTLLFGGPADGSNPNPNRTSASNSTTSTSTANEQEAIIYLQSAFATFVKDPSLGLREKFGWPLYSSNCTQNPLPLFPTSHSTLLRFSIHHQTNRSLVLC